MNTARPSLESVSFTLADLPAPSEYAFDAVSVTTRERLPVRSLDADRSRTVPRHAVCPVQRTDTATRDAASVSLLDVTDALPGAGAGVVVGAGVAARGEPPTARASRSGSASADRARAAAVRTAADRPPSHA